MGDSMSTIINATTTNGVVIQPDNSGSLQLATNSGTTAVTVDASQNVGIGTTSPVTSYRLSIYDQTNGATNISGLALIEPGSATSYSYFKTTSQASADTRTIIGNGAASRAFAFETGGTERMRIDSSGNLLIGKTSDNSNNQGLSFFPSGAVQSANNGAGTVVHYEFYRSGTRVGRIETTTSATSYVTSSDYRLKEEIAPMTGALDKVAQLKPVTYTWKVDGSNGQGFIAHELQEVIPDCVSGQKDAVNEDGSIDPQGIDTSFLVATLTAAIQEQQTIINDIKARIETLEAK
jgi:hypothetical protein